jgi:glycerate kinase
MKRFIIAPDSFKGTMSSTKICGIMEEVLLHHFPGAEVRKLPVADGGEGTVECFKEAVGGTEVTLKVCGPYFEEVEAPYVVLPDGTTAVIELAAAAGLPLVGENKNPLRTTTYGVGQMIKHALQNGCTDIVLGLGGSSTNDGGAGMAAALGIKFFDENGEAYIPVGGTLNKIKHIDISERLKELDACKVTAMCDVDNPLFGVNGAAYIFGPQKGADEKMVVELDNDLKYLDDLLQTQLHIDVAQMSGAGAAGGAGAGVVAFLGGELKPGIETVIDVVEFDTLLDNADIVFTGEGKIDTQSLRGKVVTGIAKRAKQKGVPVVAVVGDIGDGIDEVYELGVTAVVCINRSVLPLEEVLNRSESNLRDTMHTIAQLLKL